MGPATFKYEGRKIKHTPSGADVEAGDVIVQVDQVSIATVDIADGQLGWLEAEGAFELPKVAATAMPVGTIVYWDEADQEVQTTADSGANKRIGKVWEAALAADTTVVVKLNAA